MATVAEEIAALRGTKPASFKDLLRAPGFSRLWKAMLVSSLGDWVGFVAVASLVARVGGERLAGLAVAGVMLARLLPSVIVGPFAGVLADRFDRRKVMMTADVARGLAYASMPFVPTLWGIYLVSFFIESLSLMWGPAKDATIPNLVPRRQLGNANSVSLVTAYGTLPFGALICTALIGVSTGLGRTIPYFGEHPEFLALWLDALTFFFSAWMISGLVLRPVTGQVHRGEGERYGFHQAWADIREGFRFLQAHPVIRSMTLGIVIAFGAGGAVISLGPIFARYTVDAGSTGFGILMIALGAGMGIGMASLNLLEKVLEKDRIFYASLFVAGGSLLALSLMPTIGLAALCTVPMGAGAGLAWVSGYTLMQENTSDEFRGRTFATLTVSARLAMLLSLAGFPALATALAESGLSVAGAKLDLPFATRLAFWFAAVGVVLAGMISRRGLRRGRLARPRPLGLLPRLRRIESDGKLIAFEGVEGSGKGTQIELASRYLEDHGYGVIVTREPGGTEFGDRLRSTILDPTTGKVDARAEALVFAASRAHLVSQVIRPALVEGKIVLCDRFVDSSVAYQGFARGVGEQDVLTLNAWATQGLFPDLVILLNIEPEVGLERARGQADRIEAEDVSFFTKVSEAYLRIAEEHPDRFVVVDATGTPAAVHARVIDALGRLLAREDVDRSGAT